jgi:segregation and condensation protein B
MSMSETATESTVVELVSNNEEIQPKMVDEDLRLLEALLFASSSAVTERVIAERLGEDADIPALLAQLKELYKGRGVELARAGNRWFFRTAPDLGDRMKLEKIVPRKLSRAGIETLAIIAYHQPVTRAEIEEIRGVVISRGTIDILLEEGWIKPKGKRHTPGRPTTWGTSDTFLDHFGLESLNDLPGVDELKAAGLLDSRQGVSAYSARAGEGDTLLFDTEESDESIEPLSDGEEGPSSEATDIPDQISEEQQASAPESSDYESSDSESPDSESPELDGLETDELAEIGDEPDSEPSPKG